MTTTTMMTMTMTASERPVSVDAASYLFVVDAPDGWASVAEGCDAGDALRRYLATANGDVTHLRRTEGGRRATCRLTEPVPLGSTMTAAVTSGLYRATLATDQGRARWLRDELTGDRPQAADYGALIATLRPVSDR